MSITYFSACCVTCVNHRSFDICIFHTFRFGPLRNVWCMRFEAKNSYFKSLPLRNFKNISKTIATRHQGYMCMNLLGGEPCKSAPNYLYRGDEVAEGNKRTSEQLFHFCCVIQQITNYAY